jgi:hypothetical protein
MEFTEPRVPIGSIRNIWMTNDHGYVPLVVSTSRSFPHSWLITGFVTIVTRRVLLVENKLCILPEYPSSPSIVSWVSVARSLVFCVVYCRSVSCGHCVACPSSIYGILLPLWYLFNGDTIIFQSSVDFLLKLNSFSLQSECSQMVNERRNCFNLL